MKPPFVVTSRVVAALTLALASCNVSDLTPNETSTDEDGPCACIVDEAPRTEWEQPMSPTCAEKLCEDISAGEGVDGTFYVGNPNAVDCALAALRDRTPGWVTWSSGTDGEQGTAGGYILVQPEGTAVFREWGSDGIDWVVDDAVAGELPSAEHYEECLAEADDIARYNCVRNTQLTSTMVCNAGWVAD